MISKMIYCIEELNLYVCKIILLLTLYQSYYFNSKFIFLLVKKNCAKVKNSLILDSRKGKCTYVTSKYYRNLYRKSVSINRQNNFYTLFTS